MALRQGKTPGPKQAAKYSHLGGARRTQLITTYGVGSMIAIKDQSYIVSGLDSWKVDAEPDLREFRLQTTLQVKGFYLPPAADRPTDRRRCPGPALSRDVQLPREGP